MDFYKSYDLVFGYNLSPAGGSTRGYKQSEETIKKSVEARRGYRPSEETIEKIRIGNKGILKKSWE